MITWAVLRAVASIAVVTALYYLLPFDRSATGLTATLLVAGLVVFVGLVAFQVRAIIASPFPGLRAIEALATSVPLFLALFASSYFVMARLSPGSFTAPLTRTTRCTSPSRCSPPSGYGLPNMGRCLPVSRTRC